mmetsp:Transcript_23011/g.74999  ORF Transcript_23011/g.74999 Transcript_23011/m.74999 type:complete len:494 (-) Transcript_23011:948-2429(-)
MLKSDDDGEAKANVVAEIKDQVSMAMPLAFANLCSFAVPALSSAAVGRITGSAAALAINGLGGSLSNVTGNAVLIGLLSSLETFLTQSYGAGRYEEMGLVLQRMIGICFAACVPIYTLWACSPLWLSALHQNKAVAVGAGRLLLWLAPSVPLLGLYASVGKYLQAMGITTPQLYQSLIGLSVHLAIVFPAVRTYGYVGIAIAQTISYGVMCVFIVVVARRCAVRHDPPTWTGFSRAALQDWYPLLKLALPTCMMILFEWWAFEIVVLLAGTLPGGGTEAKEARVAAASLSFYTILLSFSVPFGISGAAAVRVGNSLGAAKPGDAKRAILVSISITLVTSTISTLLLLIFGRQWVLLFTSEETVFAETMRCLPIVAFICFTDAVQATMSGAVRGAGLQAPATMVNLVSFYCIGLPVGIGSAYGAGLGVPGLLTGLLLASGVQMCSLFVLLLRTDWERASREAVERSAALGKEAGGTYELVAKQFDADPDEEEEL